MKKTTETMVRRPGEVMAKRTLSQVGLAPEVRVLTKLKVTGVSITSGGLAIEGTYDPKDLKPFPKKTTK